MIEHLNNLKEPFSVVEKNYLWLQSQQKIVLCNFILLLLLLIKKYYCYYYQSLCSTVSFSQGDKILLPSSNGDIITSHLCHHHHVAICARLSGCA
jgi:hypothetical protein